MHERKVGNIGQGDFIKLCADAGLACGTSQGDDYAGWDFFVDFPLKQHDSILIDGDDRAIECKVQVKSSDNKNKSVQVKLSNLKRFCDSTVPCFFFIAEYNGNINPDNIYLVHIDDNLIFKILKRLRENQAGDKLPLNHLTMNIPYGKNDEIQEFSGKALKEKIESYVNEGMKIYVKRKENQLKTLGYEKSNYEMKFEIHSNHDLMSLARASLGYPEKINIKNIVSWDKRFNIKLLQEELTQEKAIIEILDVKPITTGEVVFESSSETMSFPCEYYVSPFSKKSSSTPVLRAKCDNIDILFNNDNVSVKVTFLEPDKIIGVFEMRDVLLTMKMLFLEDSPVSLKLKRDDGKSSIPFKIGSSDKQNNNIEKEFLLLISSVESLISFATKCRLESKIKLSMNALKNNSVNISNIMAVYNLININDDIETGVPYIKIKLEGDEISFDLNKNMCIVFVISLSFESIFLSFIFSAQGFMKEFDECYILDKYNLTFEKVITGKDRREAFEDLKKATESICDENILKYSYVFNSVNKKIMFNNDL